MSNTATFDSLADRRQGARRQERLERTSFVQALLDLDELPLAVVARTLRGVR